MKKELTFDERIALKTKRYGLTPRWQQLKYGFKRAVFDCDSFEEMYAVEKIVQSIEDAHCDRWYCAEGGVFEGSVYAMDAADHAELKRLMNEGSARLEDWWQRYHVADEETRRLMACGAIA